MTAAATTRAVVAVAPATRRPSPTTADTTTTDGTEAAGPALDLEAVRRHFPAFGDASLARWAHFENAGGSWPCRQVVDRLTTYYETTRTQPGHPHGPGLAAQAAMDAGRARLAPWLGVAVDDLHVGPSTTANTTVLAAAFAQILSPGDAIVVTQQDHEANSGPWRRLADHGVEVREWRVDPETGSLASDDLDRLLDDTVRMVAFPAASNVVGERNPVRQWCARAREVGAFSVVDAVALAPHGLPDVPALDADVVLFSAYKTFGPHQGVMTIRSELFDQLPNMGHFFNADQRHKRLVPAGPDHAQVAALAGIADYLEAIELHHFGAPSGPVDAARRARLVALLRVHEERLLEVLMPGLGDLGLRVVGPPDSSTRVPTVSVRTQRPAVEVAADLATHGLMTAGGHFYAWRLLDALGVEPTHGVLRFSFLHTTSRADVDRLLGALEVVDC